METSSDRYIREHSTLPSEALDWIEKQTNIHTNHPRMLSGRVQGELLKILVEISGATRVLEIGTSPAIPPPAWRWGCLKADGWMRSKSTTNWKNSYWKAGRRPEWTGR